MINLQELFESLSPSDKKVNTKSIAIEGINYLILIFKDSAGLAHILVEYENYVDLDSIKGIKISYKYYVLEQTVKTYFFEYQCQHKEYHKIFFPFIEDLLSTFSKGFSLTDAHNQCATLWKHFFDNPDDYLLNVQAEIGLIGELLFLKTLLNSDKNAISYWMGPEGDIDFKINTKRIEIKTTTKNMHSHTINGINQLEDKLGTKLFLGSTRLQVLTEDIVEHITLASVFQEIQNYIENDPLSIDLFFKKISLLNLSPGKLKLHKLRKYSLEDFKLFEVDDNFPKVTPHFFYRSLSNRVSNIRYDIDLEGMDSIPVDQFWENKV